MADENHSKSQVPGFEAMQGMADLWHRGGQAFFAAQQKYFSELSDQVKAAGEKAAAAGPAAFTFDAERLASSSRALIDAWTSAGNASANATVGQAGSDGNQVASRIMSRIFDPLVWLSAVGGMDQGLDHVAEGPRLADLFDTERRFLAVFNASVAVRRRSYEHNSLMLQAWMRATSQFSKALNKKADKGEKLESMRDILTIWVETANTALLETQRTEAYLESQRELVNASTDLRLAQQDVAQYYSEMFAVPTRAEIDDVHKSVTELRREVRALKRAAKDAAPRRSAVEHLEGAQ
jgi:class III poly(R)-hydroxyalkanoic acid synthase PhaE subunit